MGIYIFICRVCLSRKNFFGSIRVMENKRGSCEFVFRFSRFWGFKSWRRFSGWCLYGGCIMGDVGCAFWGS